MAWNGYSEQGQGSEERGPATFAVNVPGVVQKPEGVEFVGVRASGNMQSSGRVSVPTAGGGDNTLGELAKMGQALLAPKIKEEQDRRFVQGMAQAASGQALQEIIAEQPAYVTIFGEAPAVEGARAYTTAARKAAWVAEQQNNMANLAKIDTNEVAASIYGTMQSQMTGDPIADADIQKELLGAMPDLIRTQTKARFLHLQGEAKAARRTAMAATYQGLTAMNQTGPELKTVDQMERAEEAVIQIITPPPGVDANSHMDDITDTLVMDMQGGNFDSVRLLYANGVTKVLSPENQTKLRVAGLRAAPDALAKVMPTFIPRIIAASKLPPEEFVAEVQAINAAAAGESRVPLEYGQLLGEDYMLRGAQSSANRAATAEEKRLLALKKEAEDKGKKVLLGGLIDEAVNNLDGNGNFNIDTLNAKYPQLGFKPAEVDAALGVRLDSNRDPEAQALLMSRFSGTKISVGESMVQNLWDSTSREGAKWETHGASFGRMVKLYQNMNEGARNAYFNKDQQASLDSWIKSIGDARGSDEQQSRDMQQLFETRATVARIDTSKLRAEPDAATAEGAVIKVLEDQLTTSLFGVDSPLGFDQVTNTNVGDTEMRAARAVVQRGMRDYRGPISDEVRAERALLGSINAGIFDVAGGRLVFNENPAEAKANPLAEAVGQNPETAALALEGIVQERISARKGDDATRLVIRAPGTPIKYLVTFSGKDGKSLVEVVTVEDIKARVNNRPKGRSASGRITNP